LVTLRGSHLHFLGDTVHRSFRLETADEEDDYCPIAQANIIEAKFEAKEPQTKFKTNCKVEQDAGFKETEESEADVMGLLRNPLRQVYALNTYMISNMYVMLLTMVLLRRRAHLSDASSL
jgi:hypothetical protein